MKHWKPSTESYVAFSLVCVGVLPSLLWGFRQDIHTFFIAQFSPAWLFAWIYAISGVQHANGMARLAAIASLAVLAFQAFMIGLAAFLVALGP